MASSHSFMTAELQQRLQARGNYESGKRLYQSVVDSEKNLDHFPTKQEIVLFKANLGLAKQAFEAANGYDKAKEFLAEVNKHLSRYNSNAYVIQFLAKLTDAKVAIIVAQTHARGIVVTPEMESHINNCVYADFYDQAVEASGDITGITGLSAEVVHAANNKSREELIRLESVALNSAAASVMVTEVPVIEEAAIAGAEPVVGVLPVTAPAGAVDDIVFPDEEQAAVANEEDDDTHAVMSVTPALLKFLQKMSPSHKSHADTDFAPASPRNG